MNELCARARDLGCETVVVVDAIKEIVLSKADSCSAEWKALDVEMLRTRDASNVLEASKYGYALRMLSTISDVSQDSSNTIIFLPTEALSSELLAAGIAAKLPNKPKS